MAYILIMPRQGNTVESCIITDWKVKEGDAVSAETIVCEVETDKAAFELPAGAAGVVLKILRNAGDDVPVLEPIAVIGEAGEEFTTNTTNNTNRTRIEEEGVGSRELGGGPVHGSEAGWSQAPAYGRSQAPSCISPRARGLAEKEGLAAVGLQGSGPGGRVIERDVKVALLTRPPLTVAAKAAAITTAAVPDTGSGLAGRITVEDLDSPLRSSPPGCADAAPHVSEFVDAPVKGIRKIISDRMLKSLSETAQFTLNAQARVGRLQDIRERMKARCVSDTIRVADVCLTPSDIADSDGVRHRPTAGARHTSAGARCTAVPTVNDFILYAVSRVLPQFPYMNAHLLGETIRTFSRVHLGHAVDTPRGLMVPVIKNANLLSLSQISAEAKRLAAACQNSQIKPEELSGSTFTVSNLGSLGVTSFTPVLNTPEVGILGVCAITDGDSGWCQAPRERCQAHIHDRAAVMYGARHHPHPRHPPPYIGFSMTINHQAVDGAPAARFLKALCEAVADIDLLLAEG